MFTLVCRNCNEKFSSDLNCCPSCGQPVEEKTIRKIQELTQCKNNIDKAAKRYRMANGIFALLFLFAFVFLVGAEELAIETKEPKTIPVEYDRFYQGMPVGETCEAVVSVESLQYIGTFEEQEHTVYEGYKEVSGFEVITGTSTMLIYYGMTTSGDSIALLAEESDWYKITTADGVENVFLVRGNIVNRPKFDKETEAAEQELLSLLESLTILHINPYAPDTDVISETTFTFPLGYCLLGLTVALIPLCFFYRRKCKKEHKKRLQEFGELLAEQ